MSAETIPAQPVSSSAWLGRFNCRTENPKGWAEFVNTAHKLSSLSACNAYGVTL